MKIAIVEDEIDSRGIIKSFIHDMFPQITIVGEASSVHEGIELLSRIKVDVVLLDIQFPNGTGFDILQNLEEVNFETIFITAYDQFAIQAIKHNALDYLLKPLNREEFHEAISKMAKKTKAIDNTSIIRKLLDNFNPKLFSKIKLPSSEGFKLVDFDSIIRCEADSNYTHFHLTNGSKVLVSKTMKEFDSALKDHQFIRVHHSHIVNPIHIKEYIKGRGGDLIMNDGSRVSVSDSRREHLMDALK
ncbi:MAG: DNA-binding response regulator [Bacteroidetes bacterium]|nr:MAG: DNA-binding response regulator [Bacteroidota bacterium]